MMKSTWKLWWDAVECLCARNEVMMVAWQYVKEQLKNSPGILVTRWLAIRPMLPALMMRDLSDFRVLDLC